MQVVVDLLEEVVQVFVYKINQAALGITAVNDGPAGQFTLTSNNFDFNVSTSFNDALGDDGVISFNRTVVADGGTFIEISGTISGSLGITRTNYISIYYNHNWWNVHTHNSSRLYFSKSKFFYDYAGGNG